MAEGGGLQFKEVPVGLELLTDCGLVKVRRGLAIGRCCEVYEGCLGSGGESVAVKVFRRHQEYRGALQRERHFLASLATPGAHLVCQLGEVVWEGRDILIQELLGPTLRQVLCSHHHSFASPWLTITLAMHIIRGLRHLHSAGCVHADVKPPNLLWDPTTASFKLADLGLAFSTSENITHSIQSKGYQAPECMEWNKRCGSERGQGGSHSSVPEQPGPPADIWSAGCVIAECLVGRQLFSSSLQYQDVAGTLRSALASTTSRYPLTFIIEAYNFLSRCVAEGPEKRWSAEALLSEPWLNQAHQPSFRDLLLLPTSVLRLLNVMDPTPYHQAPGVGEILSVCKKYGSVEGHHLEAEEGKLYVKYKTWGEAQAAQEQINGMVLQDRTLVATFFPPLSWHHKNFY